MKKTTRILFLSGLLLLISIQGSAQISVSYYSSSLSKIGMGYQIHEKLWGEFRLYSNTIFDNITPELVLCHNLFSKDHHNIYLGLGASLNYFSGLVIPFGVQFIPFEQFSRFSLHIELQPMLNFDSDMILQSSWGIRYKFGKKE